MKSGGVEIFSAPAPQCESLRTTVRKDLPSNFLDVLVGPDCEFITPAQTAALEHVPPIGSGHALSKAMYTHAATDLGLICSFNHSKILPYYVKMIAQIPHRELCM